MRPFGEAAKHTELITGAIVVILVILWLDIATGVWQEVVILSGLAAGLVSFLLTVTVLNRVVARNAARRWAPVNRLAYSEFLHAIADDEKSEISRGTVVPRSLPYPSKTSGDVQAQFTELEALREQVVTERSTLASVLSLWAQFLASSGDNEVVLGHIAAIAWQLDAVRDAALELEATPSEARDLELRGAIDNVNASFEQLAAELIERIKQEPTG